MKKLSLNESGFERKTKRTHRREFLDEMNLVVRWHVAMMPGKRKVLSKSMQRGLS